MSPANAVRTVVTIVSAIYAIAMYLTRTKLSSSASSAVSYIPTAVGFGLTAFDLWLWRAPILHLFVGRPRIGGAWLGTLMPADRSSIPVGGNKGPTPVAVLIEQTYWSTVVTLMTAESRSISTTTAIRPETESSSQRILAYAYANTPDQKHRARSPRHHGAAHLAVVGRVPRRLKGSYWTDRLTVGDIEIELVDRNTSYTSLDEVKAASAKARQKKAKATSKPSSRP